MKFLARGFMVMVDNGPLDARDLPGLEPLVEKAKYCWFGFSAGRRKVVPGLDSEGSGKDCEE